jgi:hypothetical protein
MLLIELSGSFQMLPFPLRDLSRAHLKLGRQVLYRFLLFGRLDRYLHYEGCVVALAYICILPRLLFWGKDIR